MVGQAAAWWEAEMIGKRGGSVSYIRVRQTSSGLVLQDGNGMRRFGSSGAGDIESLPKSL